MNETESTATAQAPTDQGSTAQETSGMDASELARKGGIVVALLVTVVALFVAFQSVTDVIQTWLTDRWVPVWRAVFALGVAAVAVYVVKRLTT